MKIFNIILSILPLCATGSIFSARTTTQTSAQAKRRTPIKKPTKTPVTRQRPVPQPQPEQEEEKPLIVYSEILSALKQKTPDSSDISTLRNIRTEVERQINYIESTFARRIDPDELKKIKAETEIDQMKLYAENLVSKNVQEIMTELFPVRKGKEVYIIKTIVKNFVDLYPIIEQPSIGIDIIYNAIMDNREISTRFTTTPTSRKDIRDIIYNTWMITPFHIKK